MRYRRGAARENRGELDRLIMPEAPCACSADRGGGQCAQEWEEAALCTFIRCSWPYRNLDRETFESVRVCSPTDSPRGAAGAAR